MTVNLNALDDMGSLLWASTGDAGQGFSYSPFGNTPARSNTLLPGFNGERLDPVSQTYHLGNGYRTYNPVLMRFNAPDSWSPFGAGGLNPYAYCEGDPINRADPSGHMSARMGVTLGLDIVSLLGIAFTFGASIGCFGMALAVQFKMTATDVLAAASDLTSMTVSFAGGTISETNPKAAEALAWTGFALGLASWGLHAGKYVHGKLCRSGAGRTLDEGIPLRGMGDSGGRSKFIARCSEFYLFDDDAGGERTLNVFCHGSPEYMRAPEINGRMGPDDLLRVFREENISTDDYQKIRLLSCYSADAKPNGGLSFAQEIANKTHLPTEGYCGFLQGTPRYFSPFPRDRDSLFGTSQDCIYLWHKKSAAAGRSDDFQKAMETLKHRYFLKQNICGKMWGRYNAVTFNPMG